MYYCGNELDFNKSALNMFFEFLSVRCLEEALTLSRIQICSYVENLEPNEKSGEIDSCRNCDIDECFIVKNRNSENIFKEIHIENIEDVDFPCITYFDNKNGLQYISIKDAKYNTKHWHPTYNEY